MVKAPFSILECPCLPNPTGLCAPPKECIAKRFENLEDCYRVCEAMRKLRVSNSGEQEHMFPSSTDLLLIAHDEWKRREERRHIHEELPWVHGWISGYLTSRKFVNDRIKKLRQGEQ